MKKKTTTRSSALVTHCLVFLCCSGLLAQIPGTAPAYNPSEGFFSFNGRAQIFGEYASRTGGVNGNGSFTEKPNKYAYVEFSPTFAILGIPFSIDLLYSTEDQAFKQKINSFNFSLNPTVLQNYIVNRAQAKAEDYMSSYTGDIAQARDSLSTYGDSLAKYNPSRLKELEETVRMDDIRGMSGKELLGHKDLMEQAGLLSTYEKTMMLLPRVGIGTNYPQYTEYTLSGIAINGVDVEWNPGKFYFAFSTGKVLNPVPQYHPYDPYKANGVNDTIVTPPVYSRSLTAVRLGYGSKNDTYIIFSGLKANDDPNSVPLDTTKAPVSTPEENYVLDAEVNLNAWGGRIVFNGEFAASLLTSDVTASEVEFSDPNDMPQFLRDAVKLRVSSFYDWAALANIKFNLPESSTRFSAAIRRVGAGFRSLGLLNQRNDYVRYDIRADQGFLSRQLSVGGFIRHDRDNLIDWKRSTTEISAFGINLGIMPRGYPYFRAMYAPYYQRNDAAVDSFKVDNTTSLLTLTLGYGYRLLGMTHSTTLTYTTNSIRTYKQQSDFDLTSITLGHSTSFEFPLTLAASFGKITQSSSSPALGFGTLSIFNIDFSASYLLWDVWNFNAGVTLANEQANGTRTGYYFSLGVPVWKIANFDVRAEKNVYTNKSNSLSNQYLFPYDETIVRATLSKYW